MNMVIHFRDKCHNNEYVFISHIPEQREVMILSVVTDELSQKHS